LLKNAHSQKKSGAFIFHSQKKPASVAAGFLLIERNKLIDEFNYIK
jgi:hypothetical protein